MVFFFQMNSMRSWKLFPLNVLGIICVCVRFVLYIKIQASIALLDDDDYTQMHRTSFTRRNDASYPFFAKIKKRRKKTGFVHMQMFLHALIGMKQCLLCCWKCLAMLRMKSAPIENQSHQKVTFVPNVWIWVSKMPKIDFDFCIFDGCVFLSLNFRLKKKDGTRLVIPAKSNVRQKEQSKNSSCIAQSRRHFDDAEAKEQCIFSSCIHLLFILHFDS